MKMTFNLSLTKDVEIVDKLEDKIIDLALTMLMRVK